LTGFNNIDPWTSPEGSENGLNMYLSPWYMARFPWKAKTPLVKGVEKIVRWQSGPPILVGPELLQLQDVINVIRNSNL
jgi:hypothetical protein